MGPEVRSRLVPVREPRSPEAVVVVLHGGASRRGDPMVSPTQLSVLRMVPIAKRVARDAGGRLAVYRLLNSTRGWDTRHTPVDDLHWALAQVTERHPGLPVGLVGHSLGGRAALLSAGHDAVRTVVALNPYVLDDAPRARDRRVLVVHGDADRVAPLARARAVAARLSGTNRVAFVTVAGGRHAMLRRGGEFTRLASDFVRATLTSQRPRRGWSAPVEELLDGGVDLAV